MPPYVRFSRFLRPLARASQLHQHVFRQRETYRRVSTLPCFTLENKVCVVTGASQGLGQQILAAFCLSGGHGAVVDLSLDSAAKSIQTINAEVKEKGLPEANLRPYECNTADEAAVKKTWAQIEKDFGKIHVMCLNAGITGGVAAEDYDFNDWKSMLDVNVNGTFLFAREAGHHMIKNGIKGSIIMVSSMSGVIVNRPQKQSAYNTSKAAVVQMMKSFASEWGEHGIRVNAISPGYIQTAANEGEEMEKLSKGWIKDIPLYRIAKPEEFRGTAVYIASDASSYLTGSQIVVDGGYTVW
ncbi:NAD(P)-binding protein [Aureobasidium melanogenum CBS 110374]|uniref:D-arabinitol 2-dehydrogenase [ribulose-forming] n=1 Tax=Aureobasidium melanogenum (strain CBS 110374) TaxID=1043003 RepID=A0A074VDG5_AURM1|nr:NAD(P)-binding protein [Aureobasidium melanogenum CBS 110374]KEQ58413.1 NAD(P)-binding protein [Aureobasidium melanogenum CBS 110374]